MYNELERIYKEAEERGELRKAKEVSLSLTKIGFPIEKIAQTVKVSKETVVDWISGKK